MYSLVIHAPDAEAKTNNKRDFQDTMKLGVGNGYIIFDEDREKLVNGCLVILLNKDKKQRAEGKLVKLVFKGKTKSGKPRYDVYFKDMKCVTYKPEKLNRWGTAII